MFKVELHGDEGLVVVTPDVDHLAGDNRHLLVEAHNRACEMSPRSIAFDLEQVKWLNSTALQAFVDFYVRHKARPNPVALRLCRCSSGVRLVLSLTGVEILFPSVDDLESLQRIEA